MTETTALYTSWKAHPTKGQELSRALREPIIQEALNIVRLKAFVPNPLSGTAGLMEQYALMGAKREGYLDCLENLFDLASISNIRPKTDAAADSWRASEDARASARTASETMPEGTFRELLNPDKKE
jgi:hypothetical protein